MAAKTRGCREWCGWTLPDSRCRWRRRFSDIDDADDGQGAAETQAGEPVGIEAR